MGSVQGTISISHEPFFLEIGVFDDRISLYIGRTLGMNVKRYTKRVVSSYSTGCRYAAFSDDAVGIIKSVGFNNIAYVGTMLS